MDSIIGKNWGNHATILSLSPFQSRDDIFSETRKSGDQPVGFELTNSLKARQYKYVVIPQPRLGDIVCLVCDNEGCLERHCYR